MPKSLVVIRSTLRRYPLRNARLSRIRSDLAQSAMANQVVMILTPKSFAARLRSLGG
jgi:hypothetical protein